MSPRKPLLIGTAGHIDHGKSSLVRALTGVDPDRLPEERARGMTIDLGFAHRSVDECDLYFVDVPGHERFIRNMVAGATGIDVALLVVAADDSVMPQTREHVEVLHVLGVERIVVALTKIDLVDRDWADAVETDVVALLAQHGLTPLACVRASATRGDGIEELLAALVSVARQPSPGRAPYRWFRMPIDRAFSVPGRGTVVTGSVLHGQVNRGDELELLPAGKRVRVRDLQTHQDELPAASGRLRLALNLPGVQREQAPRGCELATPGYLTPTRRLLVTLSKLNLPGRKLHTRRRLRLHIGTSELLGWLQVWHPRLPAGDDRGHRLPAGDDLGHRLPAGATAESLDPNVLTNTPALLRTSAPVLATAGQHFVLRDESGTKTLGGGSVIDPLPFVTRAPAGATGRPIKTGPASPRAGLLSALAASAWRPQTPAQLSSRAGIADAVDALQILNSLVADGELIRLAAGELELFLHTDVYGASATGLRAALHGHLAFNPRLVGLPKAQLSAWLPRACPETLRPALGERLLRDGHIRPRGNYVVPAGAEAKLSAADQKLYQQLVGALHGAGVNAPALSTLPLATAKNASRVAQLAELAAANGDLHKLAAGLWLHREAWENAIRLVSEHIAAHGGQTVAAIRDVLQSSRKTVVPLLEALDRAHITRREGDLRILVGTSQAAPSEAGQSEAARLP